MSVLASPKKRIAVLRGGSSPEYHTSLKTGEHVLSLLREMPEKYEPRDIFISKDGVWHFEGRPHESHHALKHVDVVFNALHGKYGEDGQVQQLLSRLHVPYTGARAVSTALSLKKHHAKKAYETHGLLTPRHVVVSLQDERHIYDQLMFVFRNYLHPVIVKPADAGSSIGVKLAHSFHELMEAVEHAFDYSHQVIVEEYIRGKEATCGVIEHHRGERLYALIPVELDRSDKGFLDHEARHSGEIRKVYPSSLTHFENKVIEAMAKKAHDSLGLRHYSRSDFVITPRGKVYILETDALPGFARDSELHHAIESVGWTPKDFVDHIVMLAVRQK